MHAYYIFHLNILAVAQSEWAMSMRANFLPLQGTPTLCASCFPPTAIQSIIEISGYLSVFLNVISKWNELEDFGLLSELQKFPTKLGDNLMEIT